MVKYYWNSGRTAYGSERAQYFKLYERAQTPELGIYLKKKKVAKVPAVSSASLLQYTFNACIANNMPPFGCS